MSRTNKKNGSILPKKCLDINGKKFGRLSVIKFSNMKNGRAIWECKCSCGKNIFVGVKELKSGNTKSCGCLQKEKIGNLRRLPPGESAFNKVYNTYKNTAKRRGYEFNISEQEFKNITSKNCFYCGDSPISISSSNKKKAWDVYLYNGIDRVDNGVGYIYSNCVPCCKHCNTMKMALPIDVFICKIIKIYNRTVVSVKN
jgi:hypothetical protein